MVPCLALVLCVVCSQRRKQNILLRVVLRSTKIVPYFPDITYATYRTIICYPQRP
jgi:hypothetical protein